eukprot:5713606-Alexandrium_andersonii.AAC.1
MELKDPHTIGVDLPIQLFSQEPVLLELLLMEVLQVLQLSVVRDALSCGLERQSFAGGLKAQLARGGSVVVALLRPHVPKEIV